jgi:hypothetical protein
MITIGPDHHMDVRIVDCWSLLMNYMEETEESLIKIFFFGMDHMGGLLELLENDEDTPSDYAKDKVFKFWDFFLEQNDRSAVWDAELYFIPLKLGNHFFCACVNYKNNTVDVLDNTFHKDFQNSEFCKLAALAVRCSLLASNYSMCLFRIQPISYSAYLFFFSSFVPSLGFLSGRLFGKFGKPVAKRCKEIS